MKRAWILGPALALAAVLAVSGYAQEADGEGERPSGKLTVEEAGRLLATGRAAYEDGLYRLASRRLEELVAGAPDRRRQAEGALWLARVRLAEQRPAAALEVLEAHAALARTATVQADYAVARAQAHFDLGQMAEAIGHLEGFQDRQIDSEAAPLALRLLVKALAARGEPDAAREVCRLLEARHPANPEAPAAWLDLAAALIAADQPDQARVVLEHVETTYARQVWSERAALKIVELQLARGERPQAMSRLQSLATNRNLLAETRAQGYRIVAQALGAEANYPAALDMVERGIAASADPAQRLETQMVKGRLLLDVGRVEEGIALMRSVATQVPDEVRAAKVQMELADWLAQMGRWEDAAAEYQTWLDAFDGAVGTAEVLAKQAWALWEADRHAEAAGVFARAAAAETDPARRLTLRQKTADAQFASQQYSQARESYAAVLADLPAGGGPAAQAQLQLAEAELAMGATEAGEVRLLDLSRVRPETEHSRTATLRLGVLYEERGALETAMEQYGRLIETCTDAAACAKALLARGLIRYRMGAFQAALDDFSRIREEFAQTAPAAQAMFMRGWCLYLLGRDAEALRVCEQFLADYPQSEFVPDVHFWLGEHAFNHGEYDKAEQRFMRMAQEHPGSPRAADALFWAGRAATARRAYLAANEHFNALMARHPDNPRLAETLLAQGDVLSELGQFSAAILAFSEVIVRFPQTPEAMVAWGRKGDCQYTLGQENPARYEEALLSYRTLLDYAGAPVDLRLQAGYKIGRCLEKMGRAAAALDRYMEVAYSYLQEVQPPAEATVWFTRAAFGAAALQERAGNWKEAEGIYRRVADSGVPAAAEARDRMERIRRDHWVLF
jgi:TolA-binding protein